MEADEAKKFVNTLKELNLTVENETPKGKDRLKIDTSGSEVTENFLLNSKQQSAKKDPSDPSKVKPSFDKLDIDKELDCLNI
jgi:hypothetical protein